MYDGNIIITKALVTKNSRKKQISGDEKPLGASVSSYGLYLNSSWYSGSFCELPEER